MHRERAQLTKPKSAPITQQAWKRYENSQKKMMQKANSQPAFRKDTPTPLIPFSR